MATTTVIGNVVTAVINRIGDIKTAIGNATSTASGLMTAAQAKKLDGIATGANKTTITNNLTTTATGTALDAAQGYALNQSLTKIAAWTREQSGSAVFKRADHIVCMSCVGIVDPSTAIVPEGYRPDEPIFVPCYVYGAAQTSQYVRINTNGTFTYELASLAGMPFLCTASWHTS